MCCSQECDYRERSRLAKHKGEQEKKAINTIAESLIRGVNYFARCIAECVFFPRERKKEIKGEIVKDWKKAIGVLWRRLQRTANEIPLVHSALNSRAFVLCSSVRGCETRGADYACESSRSGLLGARYHLPLFDGITNSPRHPHFCTCETVITFHAAYGEIKKEKKKRAPIAIHDVRFARVRFDSSARGRTI